MTCLEKNISPADKKRFKKSAANAKTQMVRKTINVHGKTVVTPTQLRFLQCKSTKRYDRFGDMCWLRSGAKGMARSAVYPKKFGQRVYALHTQYDP